MHEVGNGICRPFVSHECKIKMNWSEKMTEGANLAAIEHVTYRIDKSYSADDIKELFLSVNWLSGKYPLRVKKALDNCETVITAWDGDKLVGLINAIDDSELMAYIHYLCVRPEYQGNGIGGELLRQTKEKYKDYLYIILIAENEGLIAYYKKNGFEHIDGRYVFAVQNE